MFSQGGGNMLLPGGGLDYSPIFWWNFYFCFDASDKKKHSRYFDTSCFTVTFVLKWAVQDCVNKGFINEWTVPAHVQRGAENYLNWTEVPAGDDLHPNTLRLVLVLGLMPLVMLKLVLTQMPYLFWKLLLIAAPWCPQINISKNWPPQHIHPHPTTDKNY